MVSFLGVIIEITSKKDLRNILVHHKIQRVPPQNISLNKEFYGLTEHFHQKSYLETLSIVNAQIKRISLILENWLDWQIKSYEIRSW